MRDILVITEFETIISGRFTLVVKGKATFNNNYLQNFDKNKPMSTRMFLDINSLYAHTMNEKFPVGNFYELDKFEVIDFTIKSIDLGGYYH